MGGIGDHQRVAVGVDIVHQHVEHHRLADHRFGRVGGDHGWAVRFHIVDHPDEHRPAHDVVEGIGDLVLERHEFGSSAACGDRQLLALDVDDEAVGQRFDQIEFETIAIGVDVVDQHRHHGAYPAAGAHRVGARRWGTVGVVGAGHLDGDLDVVAECIEGVERSVGESRRAFESVRRGKPQRRQSGRADRFGDIADRRRTHARRRGERTNAERVAFGVDVVAQHVDHHRHPRAGVGLVGDTDG